MEKSENNTSLLNDLIKINNDRVAGYVKAIKELKREEIELIGLFEKMIATSRTNLIDLTATVVKLGANATDATTVSGKVYRLWMDVKAAFTGHNSEDILDSCLFGEEAALSAYNNALESEDLKDIEIIEMLKSQRADLKIYLEKIKLLAERFVPLEN